MSRPVCLRSHALSAHVGGDYPAERTCGSNGIETVSLPYVSYFHVSTSLDINHCRSNKPYVPGQMLAPREAQLAGRELGAKEALTLFLLRRSLRVARHTVVV